MRQPVREVGELFAHGGGRGWLAVCARQHGHVCVVVRRLSQQLQHTVHGWQHDVTARVGEKQPVGEVVDVLRCAGEVHELPHARELGTAGLSDALLDEVLDGLSARG